MFFFTRKCREDILVRFSSQNTQGQHEVYEGEGGEDADKEDNSTIHQDEGEDGDPSWEYFYFLISKKEDKNRVLTCEVKDVEKSRPRGCLVGEKLVSVFPGNFKEIMVWNPK